MKRILSLLLIVTMLVSVMPCNLTVLAEETITKLELTHYGSSGSSSGTGILVATGVYPDATGTSSKAPYIDSDTGSHKTNLGSTRIGVMAFEADGVSADVIKKATLNVYVNFVNGNIGAGWLRFAAYETQNPSLTYSVGGMDATLFPAVNDDYSYDAAFWSNEKFTNSGTEGVTSGWATIDVTEAVKNAALKGDSEVVLRFQVPTGGINLSTEGDYEPYIELVTGDKYEVKVSCVDENGNILKSESEYILEDKEYTIEADSFITIDNVVYTLDGESKQSVTVTEDVEITFNYISTNSNVLAKYEFEDDNFSTGATVKDSSGNEYDATVTGGDLAIVEGVYGNGINLNGSGYVELSAELLEEMKSLDGFTINALVKKNVLQNQFLFSASAEHKASNNVSFGIIDAYNYRFEANGDKVTTGVRTSKDDSYTYLTAVFDYENSTATLYVDGVQTGSGSLTQTLESVGATVVGIGVSPWSDPYYNGYVDEFTIYSEALSADEVTKIASYINITPVYADEENNRSYNGESVSVRLGESVSFETAVKDEETFYNYTVVNEGDATTCAVYAEGLSYDYVIDSTSEKNAAYAIADDLEIGGECSEDDITLYSVVPGHTESSVTWEWDSDYVIVTGENAVFEKTDVTTYVTFTATIEYGGEKCTKDFSVLIHANDCTPEKGARAVDIDGLGYYVTDDENLIDIDLFDYTSITQTGWTSGGESLGDNFTIMEGYDDCSAFIASSLGSSTGAGSINPYIPLPEHTGEETFIISFAAYGESSTSIQWSNAYLCDSDKNNTGFVWGSYDGTNYCYGVSVSPNWTINHFAFTPNAGDEYIRLCIGWASNIAIDNISIVKADKVMIEVSERYIDNLTAYEDEQTVLGVGEYTTTLQYGETYTSEQMPENIEVDGVNYITVSKNETKTVLSDTNELVIDYRYINETDSFIHPGLLNTQVDLERIAEKVAAGEEPYLSGYNALVANSYAQVGSPRAVGTITRGGNGDNCALLYKDAHRAYLCAIRWKISGDTAYADCARDILNAWSSTLKTVTGNADRYLAAGLYGYEMACAAEIMRDYEGFELERMQDMLINVFYKPLNERFLYSSERGSDHNDAHIMNYWANWDLCNMAASVSIGVFCDRRDIYERGLEYFKNGAGNGSVYNAIPKLYEASENTLDIIVGQWQEAGRDQEHTQMGVGLMGVVCEVAWNQGDDMYSWANNRFLYGAEYVAQHHVGNTMPYTTYYWYSGQGTWSSQGGLTGAASYIRPVYEMVYNHYNKRMGLETPGLEKVLEQIRPEGGAASHGSTFDQFGFGTLLYTRDEGDFVPAEKHKSNIAEGVYRITSRKTGGALTAIDDGYVKQYAVDEENTAQLWKLCDLGNGVYKLENFETGKVMSVENDSYDLQALITTSDYEGKLSQQFAFLCFNDDWDKYYQGYYRIVPVGSGLCVDLNYGSSDDGSDILQYTYNCASNQQWELVPAKENGTVNVTINYQLDEEVVYSESGEHIIGSDLYNYEACDGFYIKLGDKAYIVKSEEQSHTVTLDDEGKEYTVKLTTVHENAVLADTFASFETANKNNTDDLLFAGSNGISDAPDVDDDEEQTVADGITNVGSARIPLLTFNVPENYEVGKVVKLHLYVAKSNQNLGVGNNMKIAANVSDVVVDETVVYSSADYANLNSLVWSKEFFFATGSNSSGRYPVNSWVTIDVTEFVENAEGDTITFALYAPCAGAYVADREKAVYGGAYEGKAAYLEVCNGKIIKTVDATKVTKNGSLIQNIESFVITEDDTVRFYCDNEDDVAFTNYTKVYKKETSVSPEEGTYQPISLGVYMADGAQVRIGEGVDENGKIGDGSGLRFVSWVNRADTLASLENAEFGVTITAESSDRSVNIPITKWQSDDVFTTALTNLNECNYNREFTATPYVKVDSQTFYGSSVTRSIYHVAAGVLKNGYSVKDNATDKDETGTKYELTEIILDVLNAYVNQVGIRLTITDDGTVTGREEGTGAYTGDLFFDVSRVDNGDESYTITITPFENAEIKSWWKEYVRINNNNSAVKNMITDDSIAEDGILTFTFTPVTTTE